MIFDQLRIHAIRFFNIPQKFVKLKEKCKPGRKPKFTKAETEVLIQNFYRLLREAAATYNPKRGFPNLQTLRINAGITPVNPRSNAWVTDLGREYQRVRLSVEGSGRWQNRFKDNRNLSTEGLDSLICGLLTRQGSLTVEQIDTGLMLIRGTKRRNLAVVVRRIKAMTISGRIKKMDGRYQVNDNPVGTENSGML